MARGLADFSPSELRAWRLGVYAASGKGSRSAEELAAAVGATKAQILAYENGHRVPDPPRIRALARALGVHPVRLMNRQNLDEWSVADLRRACGLRAEDIISQLGMSPKNYRRFENEGIVPSRRPQFLSEVAAALGLPREVLERAIDATPAVRRRQTRAAELVRRLAARYVPTPGPWKGPEATDPDLQELAAAYGRPVSRTRRVLAHELSVLRQRHLRTLREQVVASYDMDRDRRAKADHAVRRWEMLYDKSLARIPARLEQFHRNAQPSDVWQILVDLFNADASARNEQVWAVTRFVTDLPDCLPTHMVEQRTIEDVAVCRLTSAGHSHVTMFAELYAALYPSLRRPSRPAGRPARTKHAAPGVFTLPRTVSSLRFVIPPSALDKLPLPEAGRAVSVELSPRFLLTLQPHASGTAFVVTANEGDQVFDLLEDDLEVRGEPPSP